MKYPKNIYVASVDPMHFSHLNTKKLAEKELGEKVYLVICQNELKNNSTFSLEERRRMAMGYLGDEEIYLAKGYAEIRKFFFYAKRVIRGFRDDSDFDYIKRLAKFYDVGNMEDKLCLISVPERLKNISSSKIKKLVRGGKPRRLKNIVALM